MALFGWGQKPKRGKQIVAYFMSQIRDGYARAMPIGLIPRLPEAYERGIVAQHPPTAGEWNYVDVEVEGCSAILYLTEAGQIDAICFMSLEDAGRYPRLELFSEKFSPKDLTELLERKDVLNHFPRAG